MSYDRIVARLERQGVLFVIHEHEPVITIQDVWSKLGFDFQLLVKTMVFRTVRGTWVLVALRGQDRVDYRKLATALGVGRGDLLRPPGQEVEAALGFELGGIAPVPLRDGVIAIFDSAVADLGRVYCGVGRKDRTLEITSADLIRVAGGIVRPIAHNREMAPSPP